MASWREIRAEGEGWWLVLRWASARGRPTEAGVRTTIELDGLGALALTLPGGEVVRGTGRLSFSTAPCLHEPPNLEVVLECDPPRGPLTAQHDLREIRGALRDPSGKGRTLAGTLDLSERVGWFDLGFLGAGVPIARIRLEVFPSKLSYQRDFEAMMKDLRAHHAQEVIRALSATYLTRETEPGPISTDAERYLLLDAFFDPMLRAFHQIERQPHTLLVSAPTLRPVARIRRCDAATRRAILRAEGDDERLPARLPEAHRTPSTDTPANRYVRHALLDVERLLQSLLRLEGAPWTREEPVRARLVQRCAEVSRCLRAEFLRDVTEKVEAPDLVVQRSPGYRDVLQCHRAMLLAYSLLQGKHAMGVTSLAEIYELWCGVRIERLLTDVLGAPEAPMRSGLGGARRNTPQRVRFRDGTVLHMQQRSTTGKEAPDFTLALHRPTRRRDDMPSKFMVLLDAKYRLQWSQDGTASPVPEAIHAMHRYRDAMLEATDDTEARLRGVYAAAILFPHPNADAYEAEQKSAWHDLARTGVGAIPLLPSQDRLLDQWLRRILGASAVRLHRLGPGYPLLPPPRRHGAVLLAPLAHGAAQLRQVVTDRWYHMPVEPFSLPKARPTHLALTLPEGIPWLWPIEGWREVVGEEIQREASFGDGRAGRRARYWRLELGVAEALTPPMTPWQWNRHGFRVVPLEVFDLADTTLMLHGDVATTPLLRVIHHLRRLVEDGAWTSHAFEEPILDGARWVGTLRGAGDRFAWRVGDEEGSFSTEDLIRRPIGRVFDPIVKSVRRGER